MQAPNARFWVHINDGFAKLTLRDGQSLSWGKAWSHDEGWSSECVEWGQTGGQVWLRHGSDWCDCDGRLSRGGMLTCDLRDLRARPPAEWSTNPRDPELGPFGETIRLPEWQHVDSSQRDYNAEAAG